MIALLIILIALVLTQGLINKTRAILSRRRGCQFFQAFYDLRVLMRKAPIYSHNATFVTRTAPLLSLASVLSAMVLLPLGGSYSSLISFSGDIIVFCLLLGFSRLVVVLAALDSGGSFNGLGAARSSFFALILEPSLFLLLATLCLITGYDSFSEIFASFENASLPLMILSVVVCYGIFNYALVECGKLPYDDSKTHLELTMTQEAMMLDLAGVDLGFVKLAEMLKLAIFSLLVINAGVPASVVGTDLLFIAIGAVVVIGITIGFVEFFMARTRMNKNATYITTISAIGILALIVALLFKSELTL